MKSWYDLSKNEKKELKKEFNSKRKMFDLRIIFYALAILSFLPLITVIITIISGECEGDRCMRYTVNLSIPFLIFITCAIINSILISKHETEFNSWLKIRNIEK